MDEHEGYRFPQLHLHTEYSYLDSMVRLDELLEFAARRSIPALAVTDHGNIDAAVRFSRECAERGIRPIIGCEAYLCTDLERVRAREEKRAHITFWVRSDEGFANLTRMLSEANLDHFYRKPHIPVDTLYRHLGGLVVGSACYASFLSWGTGREIAANLRDILGPDFYVEMMPFAHEPFLSYYRDTAQAARNLDLPIVATNDVHYLHHGDDITHETVVNIGSRKRRDDPDRRRYSVRELWYRSEEQMVRAFLDQGVLTSDEIIAALSNAYAISEKCAGFTLPAHGPSLPVPPGIDGTPQEALAALCQRGMRRRKLAGIAKYEERLAAELRQIARSGFDAYFLVVHELMEWAHKRGIMTSPCRGSVGGSLTAYALGITEIDPLRYGLVFERFIAPGRIDFPDIDLDFEDARREEVKAHLRKVYGERSVAAVSVMGTMRARQALRDVARYHGVALAEVDACAKAIPQDIDTGESGLRVARKRSETVTAFAHKYPDVFGQAVRLEGMVRHRGVHAAGVVLSDGDLIDSGRCVLQRTKEGLTVNWDKDCLEAMGFVKFDILGLATLSVLSDVRRAIGGGFRFVDLPLDDPAVFRLLREGDGVGVFQLGTTGIRSAIGKVGVSSFEDLVAINALYRPGTLRTGILDDYADRKAGRQPVERIHPIYDEITKATYGLIVYQEQVMWLLSRLAGFPWEKTDRVRKIISKSKGVRQFQRYEREFVTGCVERGTLDGDTARTLYQRLRQFSQYAFNRSHSVGYTMLGYWTAWCKAHHRREFMAALLRHTGSDDKVAGYVNDARYHGIEVVDPHVNASGVSWEIRDGRLVAGLTTVKGIAAASAERIVRVRGGKPFSGSLDFEMRSQGTGRSVLEALGRAGALEGLAECEIDRAAALPYTARGAYPRLKLFLRRNAPRQRLGEGAIERMASGNIGGVAFDALRIRKLGDAEMEVLRAPVLACRACPLRKEASTPVPLEGGTLNVMIVCEAPGKVEDREGRPLVGPAGRLLFEQMEAAGLRREYFYLANAVRCWPSKSGRPSMKQVDECSKHLRAEMERVQPCLVLAAGNMARYAFTGEKAGIMSHNAELAWSERYGCFVLFTIHPSAVLRDKGNAPMLREAIGRLHGLIFAMSGKGGAG